MEFFLFAVYAIAACGGALAVVLTQNVVRMAFWLVVSLGAVSGLFFMMGADFVGGTQLLIYVGGTVVLLIFGVMLTASGPYVSIENSPAEMLQAGLVGLAFLSLVASTVLAVQWDDNFEKLSDRGHVANSGYNPEETGNTSRSLGTALLGMRFDKDLSTVHQQVGEEHVNHVHADHTHATAELSTGYLLPFEIVSVHLLVVLIGASYLARAKRHVPVIEG